MASKSSIRSFLLPRQIHIGMRPPPLNLGQSQLVLRELRKFGEVATFLNFKYDYRHNVKRIAAPAIAIFESPQSASNAIEASPLRIPLPKTEQDHPQYPSTATEPVPTSLEDEAQSALEVRSGEEIDESDGEVEPDTIICTLSRGHVDLEVLAGENPYYHAFHPSRHWFEVQDMMHRGATKTSSVPQIAFADCFAGRKPNMPYRLRKKISDQNEENLDASPIALHEKWRRNNSAG